MWFFISLYLQQVLGYSPIQAGLAFLPMTLSIAVCATLGSRAVSRFGAKPLLIGGMTLMTVGLILFTQISANGTYVRDVLAPSLLVAVGMGTAFVPVTISAVAGVARSEAGLASGLVNTSRLFGGALGLAILAAVATARTNSDLLHSGTGVPALHLALTNGFQVAFAVAAGFAAVGAVVAIFGLPRVASRGEAEPVAARAAEPREPVAVETAQ